MFQATFNQHRHGPNLITETTTSYKSMEEMLTAIETYFQGVLGRFTGEVFEAYYTRERNDFKTLRDLMAFLHDKVDTIAWRGYEMTIYLELDGTTGYGCPILQTIRYRCDEAHAKRLEEIDNEVLHSSRRYHYCGDPECDWDCGVLPCGCIDLCRKFCND